MFTSINAVLKQLNAEGWNDITLEYINKGVMTDTYKMHTKTKKYAVRCYPNPRRWLAEVEYSYLIDFAKMCDSGVWSDECHRNITRRFPVCS